MPERLQLTKSEKRYYEQVAQIKIAFPTEEGTVEVSLDRLTRGLGLDGIPVATRPDVFLWYLSYHQPLEGTQLRRAYAFIEQNDFMTSSLKSAGTAGDELQVFSMAALYNSRQPFGEFPDADKKLIRTAVETDSSLEPIVPYFDTCKSPSTILTELFQEKTVNRPELKRKVGRTVALAGGLALPAMALSTEYWWISLAGVAAFAGGLDYYDSHQPHSAFDKLHPDAQRNAILFHQLIIK